MAGPLDDLIAQGASGVIPAASIGVPTGEAPVTGLTPRQVLAGAGATKMQTPVMPSVNRAIPNPTVPATGGYPAGGYASEAERRADIARMAKERGLDQAQVDRLIGSEGGYATFDARQDSGTSFGPFAMHIAGKLPGTTAPGLGDEFRKATGLDPSLPQNERALNAFAMDQLKIHGFDPNIWHGLRAAGVSVGDMAAQVRRVQADQGAAAGRLDATAQGLIKQIGSERGSLAESMSRVRAAQDKADQANDAALAAISKAPAQPEIDGVKQLNGLAVLVGVLGGLFTKSPMRTSINAAASAIEAYNDHDREKYQVAYKNWQTQTGLLFKIADMTQSRVRDILYDEQMGANERNALLDTTLRAAGLSQLADKARTEGDSVVLDWMEKMKSADDAHKERMAQQDQTNAYRLAMLDRNKSEAQLADDYVSRKDAELYAQTGQHMNSDQRLQTLKAFFSATEKGGGSQASKNIIALDKDGNEVFHGSAHRGADGWVNDADNKPIPVPAGGTIEQVGAESGSGGRSGAMVLRQMIGGREVLSDLQNAVNMPLGATTGFLGGYEPGRSILGTISGDLGRELTSQDAQLMQASFASLSRELSILMSPVGGGNWAAQQIDPLVPKAGDSRATALFKMARIAQSTDNALEMIRHSPILSKEQQKDAEELRRQVKDAVPWTAAEAQQFALGPDKEESFSDFMKKNPQSGAAPGGPPSAAVTMLKSDPSAEKKAQFDEIFGAGAAAKALGQ